MGWHWTGDRWLHRPWWKVLINTVLRWLQPCAQYKWVIYTEASYHGELEAGDPPEVLGYGFGPVEHRDEVRE